MAESSSTGSWLERELSFSFRTVVHLGKIMVGGIGLIGEESLAGPEVNYVFRMEKVAGNHGLPLLVSEPAAPRLSFWLELVPAGPFQVPSFPGDHRFFSLR